MSDQTKGDLTSKQEQAITLLLAGKTFVEVAEAVGVSRDTLWGWRRKLEFEDELTRRKREVWESDLQRLRGLLTLALDVVQSDLTGDDPEARRVAAYRILKGATSPDLFKPDDPTVTDAEFGKSLREVAENIPLLSPIS